MARMKQTERRPSLFRWSGRHIAGIVLGCGVLLFVAGINSNYQIYSNGKFNQENYSKLGGTLLEVMKKDKPVSALLPRNIINPSQVSEIRLSKGNVDLIKPPKTDVRKTNIPVKYQTLTFTGQKQFVMKELDNLKRAKGSHIQLQYIDMPARHGNARPDKINTDPVGWHNYKMNYNTGTNSGKAWLMQRGHLVGYQFCGLNDEVKNLVPETAWMNAGNYDGMNSQNQESQLYVETLLANWLHEHQTDWLDLEVVPLYKGNNLIPEHVRLNFIGISSNGTTKIPIIIPSSFGVRYADGSEQITLKNYSPNAIIDYSSGRAISR